MRLVELIKFCLKRHLNRLQASSARNFKFCGKLPSNAHLLSLLFGDQLHHYRSQNPDFGSFQFQVRDWNLSGKSQRAQFQLSDINTHRTHGYPNTKPLSIAHEKPVSTSKADRITSGAWGSI